MKKSLLTFVALMAGLLTAHAIKDNTVTIVYNGSTAVVTVADNIQQYVTVSSGTSAHVVLVQDPTFAGVNFTTSNDTGEITYNLSGRSDDGSFTLEGSYKCTVEVDGLTLTNPGGAPLALMNGKRVELSAKSGTVNTLTDGANDTYNGCIHCKGHLKLKGKGTLNVIGNVKHGIYSKEYLEVKNLTLNVTAAEKDGMHCKQYFLMESGKVTISGVKEDGIQVELDGTTSTGITADHEEEDTGNFYMEDGTLNITEGTGKAIKADGTITYSGGTQNFNTNNTETSAGIASMLNGASMKGHGVYDLLGRQLPSGNRQRGIIMVRQGAKVIKTLGK